MNNSNSLKDLFSTEIKNMTHCGDCSNCGECCADVLPIDEFEIKTIKEYISKNNIKECRHIPLVCKEPILDLTCPFRDNVNKRCTIYPVRPAICRSFICSKPKPNILKEKELFHRQKNVYSMRHEFFGGVSLDEIVKLLLIMGTQELN